MSCSPCLTCSPTNFYSCTACDTTISSNFYLKGTFCQIDPVWYIQLASTCMLAIFILFPLFRKRSMVLLRILDIIQMAAYFKYINGFILYRTSYLYLGMRGMTPWNQGIQIINISNDRTVPIFTSDQSYVNQLIRITATWMAIIFIVILVGMIKVCCGNSKLQLSKFISKNMINAISLSYYITIQDISFFCANIFMSLQFKFMLDIIFFSIAILLTLLAFILLVWQFSIINQKFEEGQQNKLLRYEAMVLYRMDYDMFQTYSLPNLPSKQKKIIRYSNLIIICILLKIGYAALIASKLYQTVPSIKDQIYCLLGYIFFSQMIWYIAFPFDCKSQAFQVVLNILADFTLLGLLIFPMIINSAYLDSIYTFACLGLFGLAFISAFLEMFLNIYSFIPYDLYQVGMTIVIEDRKLRKELDQRKKQQQQNQRMIKRLKEQHQREIQEIKKQTNKSKQTSKQQTKKTKFPRDHESEVEFAQKNEKGDIDSFNPDNQTNNQQVFKYPIEQNGSQQDQISKYRIDLKKKRKVYEFDKRKPFIYSNKLQV